MAAKKIYCEVLEGVTYSDRCLFKLSKVIEGNAVCEECIFRQLERLKSAKTNVSNDVFISKTSKTSKTSKISKGPRRRRRKPEKESKSVENIRTDNRMYSTRELSQLLGKAKRTVQEMAQKGKIPAVRVGIKWYFPKEEIDGWISNKKDGQVETQTEGQEEPPEFPSPDSIHTDQGESGREA